MIFLCNRSVLVIACQSRPKKSQSPISLQEYGLCMKTVLKKSGSMQFSSGKWFPYLWLILRTTVMQHSFLRTTFLY